MRGSKTIIVAALFAARAAFAQPEAVTVFRDYLPQQIAAMSEEQRGEVPIMYLQAANLAASPFGDLVLQGQLNELMYNGLGDYEGAKRAYQVDLGERPSGELSVWQIHQLGYRAERKRLNHVWFFSFPGGTITDESAIVRGTVKILEERIAYPVNHVKIDCWKVAAICRYQQFVLNIPDENSWAQSYGVMELVDEYYRVTRWENQQIDAVPTQTSACRINQLSLNFATQEFYEIARNNTAGAYETLLGGALEPLRKPRVSQIVDGEELISAEFKAISAEVYGYLASSYRQRAEQLTAQVEAETSAE